MTASARGQHCRVIPWRLPKGSISLSPPIRLIPETMKSTRLGAPSGCPVMNAESQVIENMVGEAGFEPAASWSRNKENQPSC